MLWQPEPGTIHTRLLPEPTVLGSCNSALMAAQSPCNAAFLNCLSSAPPVYPSGANHGATLHSSAPCVQLWKAYLAERREAVRGLPVTHRDVAALNNTYERALVTMHKMPRIWLDYLEFLVGQRIVTRARRTFDNALRALPITQHDRLWPQYLVNTPPFELSQPLPHQSCQCMLHCHCALGCMLLRRHGPRVRSLMFAAGALWSPPTSIYHDVCCLVA